jgi:PAS domain S-box-containing protein
VKPASRRGRDSTTGSPARDEVLVALFDNALDAILLANDEGRYVDANPAACALLGRPRDEILKLHVWELRGDTDKQKAVQSWRAFINAGSRTGSYTLEARDGERRDVEFRAVANVLPGVHLAILRDVSERNRAQHEAEKRLQEVNTRLRSVSARARARRAEDRTRLSRELHDQLGQAMASLKIDLCWLGDRINEHSGFDEAISAKLRAMTALADDTIVRIRRISSELRPSVLDRLGLVAAIEWQLDEFGRRTGVHVRNQSRLDSVALDRGRATAIFRIFQEALNNVAMHANATEVTVRLAKPSGHLVVVVSDNGRGIGDDQISSDKSLGLIGMRERTELLGGGLEVRAGRPHGTIVTVTIPLDERRQSARESW